MKNKLFILGSKIRRSINILFDKPEIFEDEPFYRFLIIHKIFKEK